MKKKWLEKIKKHVLPLLLSGLTLLLVIVLLLKKQFKGKLPVPIAHLEVKDTLSLEQKLSRLEAYEQKQKDEQQRKLFPSEPIALDLGRVLSGEPLPSMSPVQQAAQPQASASTIPAADSLPNDGVKSSMSLFIHDNQDARRPDDRRPDDRKLDARKANARKSPGEGRVKKPRKQKQTAPLAERDGFFTLKATPPSKTLTDSPAGAFYRAVVEGKQKIAGHSSVRIRLLEDIPLEEEVIPKYSLLFGRVRMGSQGRLQIKVHSFQGEALTLIVYDQDYQEGIAYSEQEPVSDALEEGKEAALQEVWNALPYGGLAGSALTLGKNLSRRLTGKRSLLLADHYPLLLKVAATPKTDQLKGV